MNKSYIKNIKIKKIDKVRRFLELNNKKIGIFLNGIIALMFSQIVVKILGMIYSLYLTNKEGFGDSGNAIYISSYQIYAVFLTISSIGIPNAVSKMIAESLGIGDTRGAKRIFRVAIAIFSLIGFLCSLGLYICSDFIAQNLLGIKAAADILKILSPSIFFVSIASVIRGYFNGKQNIKISATALSFEQAIKTGLTIIIVEFVSRKTNFNTEIMAKSAMIAASVATIFSFAYIFFRYVIQERKNKTDYELGITNIKKSARQIFKEILAISIPLSIASFVMVLGKNIDSITIMNLLKDKLGEELARERYGILSSKVELLSEFPMSLNGAIAISLIPEVAKLNALNRSDELNKKIDFSLSMTAFIVIPIMIGMFFYSNDIINLLYPNANKGGELLRLASISIIFCGLTQTITGIMQGVGEVKPYLKAISISMIIKLFLNLILIPIDGLLEKGAIISSIVYDVIIFIVVYSKMKEKLDLKLNILSNIIRFSSITVIAIFSTNILMDNFNLPVRINTIFEILSVAFIYFILAIIIFKKNNFAQNIFNFNNAKRLKNQ